MSTTSRSQVKDLLFRGPIRISEDVLQEIVRTIGSRPPETGGLLGGNRELQQVTHFMFDESASTSGATYSPNTDIINSTLEKWDEDGGHRIIGFVHSHPGMYDKPSPGDVHYAQHILTAIPAMQRLFLPIAVFRRNRKKSETEFVLSPHVIALNEHGEAKVEPVAMEILNQAGDVTQVVDSWHMKAPPPFAESKTPYQDDTFIRVRQAYDLALLQESRIVAGGAGGAADFLECMARAGVGQFVLIDPDTVSLSNLATQQTYRRDLGRPKVEVLSARIRDINPAAEVIAIAAKLDDLDDARMEALLLGRIGNSDARAKVSVLCGLTDYFPAQARINRLALQFAVPSLCAQVYREGRGAEVTFTHPDITPACHRCALSGRYQAHESGTVEIVGSAGTPIFATTRLNAIKGFLALALLHAGTDHPRWGRLLAGAATRNLVLVRMDPDLTAQLGLSVFDRTFGDSNRRVYFDETIWTSVTPDDGMNGADLCPDCRGTGSLRNVAGSFEDTIRGTRRA